MDNQARLCAEGKALCMLQGNCWIRDIPAEHDSLSWVPTAPPISINLPSPSRLPQHHNTHLYRPAFTLSPPSGAFPTVETRGLAAADFDLDLSVQLCTLLLWCAPMCVNRDKAVFITHHASSPPTHPPSVFQGVAGLKGCRGLTWFVYERAS